MVPMPRITGRKKNQPAPRVEPALPRQHLGIDHAGDQDRDRRIKRQHVMRQLGDHEFQHDPGRHDPAQQEFRALLAPRRPDARNRHGGERRARPERHPEQREIVARRRAVRLLRADHLAHQVVADRLGKEIRAGTADDGEEPGQHQNAEPDQPGNRPQRREPAHRAIDHSQRQHGQPDEHHDQRSLDQDAGGERGPEDRRQRPAGEAGAPAGARRDRRAPSRPSRRPR